MIVSTLLFDMDGLLVDSEPYWKLAEKEVFGAHGLNLSDEMLREVMGFRLNEVVQYWYAFQPWENPDFLQTERAITDCMKKYIQSEAKALPGVIDSLEFGKRNGYKMALASSSSIELIETIVDALKIRDYFTLLYSADFEKYGKPHPGIFISAAEKCGSVANECLVLEDSVNGVIAAKSARMVCVAIPEKEKLDDPRFSIADKTLSSLIEFPTFLTQFNPKKNQSNL